MFGRKPTPPKVTLQDFRVRLDSLIADHLRDVNARQLADSLEQRVVALRMKDAQRAIRL